jgi:hypothetical protein
MGDAGDGGLGGAAGVVSAGGVDCTTLPLPPPACLPITTDSLHVSIAYAQLLYAPGHVSLTADITALYSGARASALTFSLPS